MAIFGLNRFHPGPRQQFLPFHPTTIVYRRKKFIVIPSVLNSARKTAGLLFLILIHLCLQGCQSYSKPAYSGRVVDAEDGSPIPYATVEVEYWIGKQGLIEQKSKSIYWSRVKTDNGGYFEFPAFNTLIGAFSWERSVTFTVLKDGYTEIVMLDMADCLSNGCDERIFKYSNNERVKVIILSHRIKPTKLSNE